MKNIIYSGFLLLTCSILPYANAQAFEPDTQYNFDNDSALEKEGQGFSLELAGDPEEEGALELFVKNTSSEHEIHDITADDLNRINPAAGIKLQFEF